MPASGKKKIEASALATHASASYAQPMPDPAIGNLNEVELVQKATEVLGSQRVASWIQSNIPSLGGETPYRLMQTAEGRRQVERVLLMIEHGVY